MYRFLRSTRVVHLKSWAFHATSSSGRFERMSSFPLDSLFLLCTYFLPILTPLHPFQEPGANASEIYSVLKHVRPGDNFEPNFEMFAKSDVNGKSENPIYSFLKGRCPSVRAEFQASYKLYYEPFHQDDIR